MDDVTVHSVARDTFFMDEDYSWSNNLIDGHFHNSPSTAAASTQTLSPPWLSTEDAANNVNKITNKCTFYLAQAWKPDSLKVLVEGLVVTWCLAWHRCLGRHWTAVD